MDGWEEKTFKFVNALLKKPKISKSFLRSLTDKTLKCPSSNPSSATTPFRKYWKAIIEPYTGLLEYPTDSSQLIFKTSDGHTFAKGYNRILYGGHGPYIEFSKTNVVLRSLIKKDRSLAKKRYYDLLYSNDESVKLYYQLKEVKGQKLAKPDSEMPVTDPTPVRDGYASYVIGMFYLSATRVLSGQIQVLTKKKLTSPPLSSRKETPSRKIPRKKMTESTGMGHQPPTVILLRPGKKTTSINLSDWLTDSLLFRFLELVLLDAARLQSDTKTCPMLHYPVHHTLVVEGLWKRNIFNRVVIEKNFLLLPVNMGPNLKGHWIIYVIDCRQNPTTIWKFDPFGERLHQPSQPDRILDQTLKQRYPGCRLLILNERVQYDGCQCGVWCCAFVTKFLSFSELSRPRLFTLIPDYFVNTNNHLEMTSNTERIRDYRKTLQLLLIDKNE